MSDAIRLEQGVISECYSRLCVDCSNNSRLEWSDYACKWVLKEQPAMNFYVRYINGKDEYCIHGMCMTSRCESCEEMREQEIIEMNKTKMTREEAVKKASTIYSNGRYGAYIVDTLEALGLIKFEEEKKVKHCISFDTAQFKPNMDLGIVKLEMWPEGLVLWVGGEIVWKSWEKYYNASVKY